MNIEDKKLMYILIGLPAVIFALFFGIFIGERNAYQSPVNALVNTEMATPEQFSAFWKVWSVLDDRFVNAASTTAQEKVYGAIQGLTASYGDPYTVFFPPVESKMFKDDISGDFEGVGMEIGVKNRQLQVVSPIKGSPADLAGVKPGDYILAVNGTSTAGMGSDEAVKLIRGPKGTKVKITFLVSGSPKPIDKVITRDIINIPTINTDMKPGKIFVISLYSFTSQSPELFRNALRSFVLSGSHKLVLDLRGNPGGYLDAAWDMASYFLPLGAPVVIEDFGKNAPQNIFRSKGYNVFGKDLKMIVLVNEGSASAAEILAGALREHNVAKLVGAKTYGKGSVQELIPITSDTSLKVTIARWLTPKGHNLSNAGLEPDYAVPITEKDVAAKHDPQMEKALELLNIAP